jgi:catechol 2,3-dioxygenase-like lactoylglutathione lyase family enzyme
MHKSKLGGFIIDCRTDDLPRAADFWSGALGMPAASVGGSYRKLHDAHLGLNIEVQQVDHPSRVHLDIETDDIEAEVERLETLGA